MFSKIFANKILQNNSKMLPKDMIHVAFLDSLTESIQHHDLTCVGMSSLMICYCNLLKFLVYSSFGCK